MGIDTSCRLGYGLMNLYVYYPGIHTCALTPVRFVKHLEANSGKLETIVLHVKAFAR